MMKKKYDFSNGVKGKFHIPANKMELPIYLNKDNREYYMNLSKEKNIDISKLVNQLLSKDRELIDTLK